MRDGAGSRRCIGRGATALAVLVWAVMVVFCSTATAVETAQELFEQGNWEEAQEEAWLRDDADSLRLRARFALWRGDDDEAYRFAETALEVAGTQDARLRAEAEVARLQWFFGDRDAAIERLREQVRLAPDHVELRYELGWRLIDDGDVDEGRAILEALARRFNDGLIEDVDELVWLGRAMEAAQRPRDANRAFSRALNEDEDHLEASLRFGQLMLGHHNVAEAEGAFEAVLEHNPHHPEALMGMAHIEFYQSGRFARSMELVDKAREHYPAHPEVLLSRAELLIAQGAWVEGREVAQRLLERSPEDTRALSLVAAASHLLADEKRYDEVADLFDERRSNRPDLLTTTAEFAALNNRHRASVPLFEAALERDERHGPALAGLGMALTRTGRESQGIDILERAFDVDRFHVPVYNMLELYERGLRDYVTTEVEGFKLRAHRVQFDLIRKAAEPLWAEAQQDFQERYGVELPEWTLEVFADRQSFSVRSVGLPHVDPHGICFGRVVMTRGPGEANFNWEMVVWHELAHSYHLKLSDERVPIWFTEGLAEYETRRRDPSWTRFHDLDIARRVAHGRLWSISEMDEVFMTGRGSEVSHAYQLAMLMMLFLEDRYGFEVIVEMLQSFAHTPTAQDVFEAVLQSPVEAVDAEFEAWLRDRYSPLLRQELVDWMRVEEMAADEDVEHASSSEADAYRALLAALARQHDRARALLDEATDGEELEPSVLVLRAMVLELLDDVDGGIEAGIQALEAGVESYDLRVTMMRMATKAEKRTKAYVHARSATMLAPDELEAWHHLRRRAEALEDERTASLAIRNLYERDPHTADFARRRLGLFEAIGDYDGAYRAARRWTQIAPLDARSQLALARSAVRLGDLDGAEDAWERAALASPGRADEIWESAAEKLRDANADERARKFEERLDGAADEQSQ